MSQENAVVGDHQNGGAQNGSSKGVSFFSLKPQLIVEASKAVDAIQFYKDAFGAQELKRDLHPKRKAEQELPLILSAQLKIGSSILLISDKIEESQPPVSSKGCGLILCLETNDLDGAVTKAVDAGATLDGEIMEGEGACSGGRVAKVKDQFGFVWLISSPAKKCVDVEA